jgi:predicted ester cyclase
MSIEQNKQLVRRFYEGDFIRAIADNLDEYFEAAFVDHNPPGPGAPTGHAGVRAVMAMLGTAFPERTLQLRDLVGEGDRVVIRFTIDGKQDGAFAGRPATGKPVTLEVIAILRLDPASGKIAERWGIVQFTGLEATGPRDGTR